MLHVLPQGIALLAEGALLGAVRAHPGASQPEHGEGDGRLDHQLAVGQAGDLHGDEGHAGEGAQDQADLTRHLEQGGHDGQHDGGDDGVAAAQGAQQAADDDGHHHQGDLAFGLGVHADALDDPVDQGVGDPRLAHQHAQAGAHHDDEADQGRGGTQRGGESLGHGPQVLPQQQSAHQHAHHDSGHVALPPEDQHDHDHQGDQSQQRGRLNDRPTT